MLMLYYSFSGQTSSLLYRFASGLKRQGVEVVAERLHPVEPLRFPLNSFFATIKMMLTTFLRFRVPIQELSPDCSQEFDLIVLAGPTWSYNPSGPVLALLDRDGKRLFAGRKVLPLISCRGYWRMHWYGLRRLLRRCGAEVPGKFVFAHPTLEPWRTVGVFLKIAGKMPERSRFMGRHYKRYGHSHEQQKVAFQLGRQVGEALVLNRPLGNIKPHAPYCYG